MDDLRQKYLDAISNAADEAALEETRLAAVGKKGEVSLKMRELGKMTPEERLVAGQYHLVIISHKIHPLYNLQI